VAKPTPDKTTREIDSVSKQRNVMTRIFASAVTALTVGGVVVGGLAGPVSAADSLPNHVAFTQWSDGGLQWTTGDLNFHGANDSNYTEGDTVPFLLDVTSAGTGTYAFSVCRDYMDGNAFGYLSLQPYDTSRVPVLAALPIVTDAATGSSEPFTGAAVGGSVLIDSVHEVGGQGDCKAGQRETQVQITIGAGPGGIAPVDAYVLWGGRLASPVDAGVGAGNGASQYPGATLSMQLLSASKNLSIKVGAASIGSLTVNDVIAPSSDPGKFDLQIDGTTAGTGADVGNGGTTGAIVVYSGSHDVGAAGSGGTNLGNYTSSTSCVDSNGPVAVIGDSVSVADGQDVVCTVTLTPDPAVVTGPTTTTTTTTVPDPTTTTTTTTTTTVPSTTTTTTVPDPIVINDPLPTSTTTTTTIAPAHHHQPADDDGSGGDNSDVDPTDTTPTTVRTTTTAPAVDPGTTVAGGGQTAGPAPQVLGTVVERPAPSATPAPAATPAPTGTLPRTGSPIGDETGLATALLAAGLSALGLARRRRPSPQG
jgi:hypothetical protein